MNTMVLKQLETLPELSLSDPKFRNIMMSDMQFCAFFLIAFICENSMAVDDNFTMEHLQFVLQLKHNRKLTVLELRDLNLWYLRFFEMFQSEQGDGTMT